MSEFAVSPQPESHQFDPEPIWTGMGPSAEMEAVGIESVLSSAGIDCIVKGSSQIPTVPFAVLVAHGQAAQARQVLADALASGPEGATEAEQSGE